MDIDYDDQTWTLIIKKKQTGLERVVNLCSDSALLSLISLLDKKPRSSTDLGENLCPVLSRY